jgi:hypothetical protein
MTRRLAILLCVCTTAAAGCGGDDTSTQDKALNDVCDARADIGKQVDTLKQLTPSTITADQMSTSVTAIGNDLKQIGDAQGSLSDARRKEIADANKAFSAQIRQISSTLLKSTSVDQARAQLQTAVTQLADAYRTSLAPIDCS